MPCPQADRDVNLAAANFREFFGLIKRQWKGKGGADSQEEKSRSEIANLLGE